jgi:hypothetical protein
MSNRIDIITLLLNFKYNYPKYGIRKEFILLHTAPSKVLSHLFKTAPFIEVNHRLRNRESLIIKIFFQ